MDQNYDYIIVGAGSAGCVIATRLIEETKAKVLLIESGPTDKNKYIHMPAGLPFVMASHTWKYQTEPEPYANNRRIDVPQGKVLGGSSSVNGMAYVRGIPHDYEEWKNRFGCEGWGYEEVLNAFKACERNESLSLPYHGTQGHLYVTENRHRHALAMAYLQAAQEMGYEYVTDFNGQDKEGVGFYQATIHKGKRASTVYSYLNRVKDNPLLTLKTDCTTHRILIENGQAVGVEYQQNGGSTVVAKAKKEVIVSAGAIGSPKLLLLSGIGPKDHLEEMGIPVLLESSQVGKNFQDHLHLNVCGRLKEPMSILSDTKGFKKYWQGLNWLLFKGGVVTSNILESGGFFDLDGDGRRDTQIHTFPLIENFGLQDKEMTSELEGFTLKMGHLYPESRGEVKLRSRDVNDLPKIYGNYFSAPGDLEAQVRAVKFGVKMFDMPSLKNIVHDVVFPDAAYDSDDKIADFVRENAQTVFHPVGTCAMGGAAATSVVDPTLKVWGIKGLRVADSSAFPHIISGNTNAPVIMLAHRVVDFILKETASHA
ncbi:GMC family oxidoreductase [Thorsellia kenyensis]|uniref:GMC family oxidoreductase n=1 Tax=Thorsellia kenyensis TaxID=1549888 RepID=A0ABV6CF39_9GAMM